jgi:hypothetical protein
MNHTIFVNIFVYGRKGLLRKEEQAQHDEQEISEHKENIPFTRSLVNLSDDLRLIPSAISRVYLEKVTKRQRE